MFTKETLLTALSNALLRVRLLGGQELFIKVEGNYYADPEYCGKQIEDLKLENHKLKMWLSQLEKHYKFKLVKCQKK